MGDAADVFEVYGVYSFDHVVGHEDLAGDDFLGTEPAGDTAGVLGAEEEAALDQLLGLFDLLLGDVIFNFLKLVHYATEGLGGAGGIGSRGHAQGTAVDVVIVVAEDAVGEAPVLS